MNDALEPCRLAIIGRGRMGTALARGLREVGVQVLGPLGREFDRKLMAGVADAVLVCVPDTEISTLSGQLPNGLLVGHCSGATGLDVLAPHEAFSLHPLMTLVGPGEVTDPARAGDPARPGAASDPAPRGAASDPPRPG